MSPAPARDSTAGRAYNDLRNLARRGGRDPAELFTLYALEGFLIRLAAAAHADDLILKGGVLMAAFAARRPTRDIDLAAIGISNDLSEIERRVRDIVAGDVGDGLTFDETSIVAEPIRDEADYTGVRVRVTALLASARIALHVDVNFGDPIWPAPDRTTLPLLLGGTLELRGYPDHMVLAEKIVTTVDRGQLTTRWRDFVDIVAITDNRRLDYADVRTAIETVAAHRRVDLRPLGPLLAGMPDLAQRRWTVWRSRQSASKTPHRSFSAICCITAWSSSNRSSTALRAATYGTRRRDPGPPQIHLRETTTAQVRGRG
ncbi:nucleotidyl transferase AbiEii/AbiGii toxin family protein [Aeromicrobium sp. YIM 150415]|uniref:nucleotidyl transferase AbiEii/AbiGii toxin family protein n=1 Tax=Aeromicrobium sp. YIM 150415 TaxID=2803912 RepID=UPI001965F442|nr:nucleotidyl transferase AbiEii/AbiGii toxin family protein [Aeromicrobium sp. YIM 150415]MBM9464129.1 nucleotidyl transferase AbiEii/AbiGii toxin family protein [Aeromicrobium sp. YIM 150415]